MLENGERADNRDGVVELRPRESLEPNEEEQGREEEVGLEKENSNVAHISGSDSDAAKMLAFDFADADNESFECDLDDGADHGVHEKLLP